MNQNKSPSFYQYWSPAGAGFLLNTTSIGLFGVYGLFVNVVADEFNSSAAALGIGMALIALVMGLAGPIIGPLLDRYSIKKIMVSGVLVMLLSFLALSRGSSLALMGLMLCCVGVGIALYGQLPANVMLVNNYIADRGRALSIAAAGASFGGVFLPPLAALLMSVFGWRNGLVGLAFICGTGALVSILFGLRHYKKLEPVIAPAESPTKDSEQPVKTSLLRSKAFWLTGICFGLSYAAGAIYSFALIPPAQNLGYDIQQAALILSVGGAFGFVGKISYAIYADKLRDKLIPTTFVLLSVQLLIWLTVIHTDNIYLLYLSAAGVGLCSGTFLPLYPVFISTYFDESVMGKVSGNQGLIFLPFMLLAAPMAGVAYDTTGSYVPIFWAVFGVTLVMMTLFIILGKPQRASIQTVP